MLQSGDCEGSEDALSAPIRRLESAGADKPESEAEEAGHKAHRELLAASMRAAAEAAVVEAATLAAGGEATLSGDTVEVQAMLIVQVPPLRSLILSCLCVCFHIRSHDLTLRFCCPLGS